MTEGTATRHLTTTEIEAGMDHVRASPRDRGTLEMIVRRPALGEREVLEEGRLDLREGLVGDSWIQRDSSRWKKGPHPDMQINIMNARIVHLIAGERERWALAGDQLYVDLDLSGRNLPAGTRLEIGSALLEVTAQPHTGCKKFVQRFGLEAMKFVNSELGREHNLRGINARVVRGGTVRPGDEVRKVGS